MIYNALKDNIFGRKGWCMVGKKGRQERKGAPVRIATLAGEEAWLEKKLETHFVKSDFKYLLRKLKLRLQNLKWS